MAMETAKETQCNKHESWSPARFALISCHLPVMWEQVCHLSGPSFSPLSGGIIIPATHSHCED